MEPESCIILKHSLNFCDFEISSPSGICSFKNCEYSVMEEGFMPECYVTRGGISSSVIRRYIGVGESK